MAYDYSGILIVSDVDETLTYYESKMSDENVKAVDYFTQNGGLFTLATGRPPLYPFKLYSPPLNINAPLCAIGGAAIISHSEEHEVLWDCPMDGNYAEIIDRVYSKYRNLLNRNILINRFYDQQDVGDDFVFEDIPYYKLSIRTNEPKEAEIIVDDLKKHYGDQYYLCRSWDTGIEVTNIKARKSVGVEKIKEMTGAKIAIGIGNYENDIALLEGADIAVVVENAIPELKKIADYTVAHCQDHALKDLIEKIPHWIG